MRLEEFRVSMIREAMRIYAQHAFESDALDRLPAIEAGDDEPLTSHLGIFVRENSGEDSKSGHRLIVRLGNTKYPFMKFVLQEHLIKDEYFLSVDTHDDAFPVEGPEKEDILRLKRFNLALKEEIERAWHDAGIPTYSHLRGLVESLLMDREPSKEKRILLVDDEKEIADTLELLLTAKGFDVDRAHDGLEALDRVDPAIHDLILMDNEMPHLHGLRVCEILKEKEETRGIPILLATAGKIDMKLIRRADGFLAKPFQSEILFSFIDHLLFGTQQEPEA